ncbi:MAG TPA: hypothetical protein VNM72_10495, partial [Blastocatellia bacterium]|nr:hypothetical protein [Blastocatellia bacterium]
MRRIEVLGHVLLLAGVCGLSLPHGMKAQAPVPERFREIVLEGIVTSADSGKYLVREFTVPEDTIRL